MNRYENHLLLTYSAEIENGEPLLVSSNCFPVKAYYFEPAGHAFHSAALKLLGLCYDDEVETDVQSVLSDDRGQEYFPSSDSCGNKGEKKSSAESKQKDHYALLGLGHLRFLASEEQIRKGYLAVALKHHPDKQAKMDEIQNNFNAIHEAYEILIDPVKRRAYDSTDKFDDYIPDDCAPQDFFKAFGPAFMRNGRWSVNQPVPSLGDDSTPMKDVDSFYNFWYNLKSWREFPHADEFDLELAESRDHKRWMERRNTKLREKARKEEHARIRALVDNAYKRDPRILRRKEEEKAEKKRKKEEKIMARRMQEEEAARAAEKEKQEKEEQERKMAAAALNQKKIKEKEKKLLRKERARLRTLSSDLISENLLDLSEDIVESICMSLEMEQLKLLCDNMEGKAKMEKGKLLRGVQSGNNSDSARQGKHDSCSKPNGVAVEVNGGYPLGNYQKKEKEWGKEEIEILTKGMHKYPKGTSRRWEVISEYIGTGRSVEEILKATKTVLLQKPDSGKAFDSFLEKRKPVQTISSPLSTRVEAVVPLPDELQRGASATLFEQCTSTEQKKLEVQSPCVVSSIAEDTWSETQEEALIQALKTFPKDVNQRWERVAAAVPGKITIQCKKKFASMKVSLEARKQQNSNSSVRDFVLIYQGKLGRLLVHYPLKFDISKGS